MITLYDYATKLPGKSYSPYVWRTRFALNIKGLKHQTHWITFANIPELKDYDIPLNPEDLSGKPGYTVPAISDDCEGQKVVDSVTIGEYLDRAYPDTPKLYARPQGSSALNALVESAFDPKWDVPLAMIHPTWVWMTPWVVHHGFENMEDPSSQKFRMLFRMVTGTDVDVHRADEEKQKEALDKMRAGFSVTDAWLEKAKEVHGGKWALGHDITAPDLSLGSALAWIVSAFGEDSKEWKVIAEEWDGGRWGGRWAQLKPYATVH